MSLIALQKLLAVLLVALPSVYVVPLNHGAAGVDS